MSQSTKSILDIWVQTVNLAKVILCHLTCHSKGITTQIVQQIIVFKQMSISHKPKQFSTYNFNHDYSLYNLLLLPFLMYSSPKMKISWNIFQTEYFDSLNRTNSNKRKIAGDEREIGGKTETKKVSRRFISSRVSHLYPFASKSLWSLLIEIK